MDLIPEELRAKIPQLGEASEQKDPTVWAKLIAPGIGWTWYVIEMQPVRYSVYPWWIIPRRAPGRLTTPTRSHILRSGFLPS